MKTYSFTLLVEGPDLLTERHLSNLFVAGCDDATFGRRDGVYTADFDREAASFPIAVTSAIEQVESAIHGAMVRRVEPDDVVSASIIAERTGRSREGIRLLINGERGPGEFPVPMLWIDGGQRFWRWNDVVNWFDTKLGEAVQSRPHDRFIAALNVALELRNSAEQIADPEERYELGRIVGVAARRLAQTYDSSLIKKIVDLASLVAREYIETNDRESAFRHTRELYDIYSKHPNLFSALILNGMGYIYLAFGEFALASTVFENALRGASHADKPLLCYNLAVANAALNNFSEANALLDLSSASLDVVVGTKEEPHVLCLFEIKNSGGYVELVEAIDPVFYEIIQRSKENLHALLEATSNSVKALVRIG